MNFSDEANFKSSNTVYKEKIETIQNFV